MRIDGKEMAKKLREEATKRTKKLVDAGEQVKLAVVIVGDDKPSHTYVRMKQRLAEKVGMDFEKIELPGDISQEDLISKIEKIQEDPNLTGLIVQLPLPEHLYTSDVLNAIEPRVDVDCLTDVNMGKIIMKTNEITPPTPGAILTILENLNIELRGKDVTIVGTGALVGKPLAAMLMNMGASVTTCNSSTKNTEEKCKNADILVSAVGKKDLIRGNMVKPDAIVIDAGVDYENNVMFGDVNVAEVEEVASAVTPTPGGVGPLTVARLILNTVILAEKN